MHAMRRCSPILLVFPLPLAVKYGARQHHWNFGDRQPVQGVTPDDVAHITAYVRHQQREAGIQ